MTDRNRQLTPNELEAVSGGGEKLGNTRIQTLMSSYNEAQTTLSSILKSQHDTQNTIIGKI
jgi:hypothetical protein